MLIQDAQQDLRHAYVGGGPGVIFSGLVWLAAAYAQYTQSVATGFATLFFGGMLIFPLSKLSCRALFHRPNETPGNPFGMTVLESTIAMIGGLFAAWLFVAHEPDLVFPLAGIAVGTHYFVFKTVYGDRSFWLLGAIITGISLGDIFVSQMHGWTALIVALVELVFGLILTLRAIGATRKTVATIN